MPEKHIQVAVNIDNYNPISNRGGIIMKMPVSQNDVIMHVIIDSGEIVHGEMTLRVEDGMYYYQLEDGEIYYIQRGKTRGYYSPGIGNLHKSEVEEMMEAVK